MEGVTVNNSQENGRGYRRSNSQEGVILSTFSQENMDQKNMDRRGYCRSNSQEGVTVNFIEWKGLLST